MDLSITLSKEKEAKGVPVERHRLIFIHNSGDVCGSNIFDFAYIIWTNWPSQDSTMLNRERWMLLVVAAIILIE